MSIRPSIPDVQGIKDANTREVLRALKTSLEMITGRGHGQKEITAIGEDANFYGLVQKVNEIIYRLQSNPNAAKGALGSIQIPRVTGVPGPTQTTTLTGDVTGSGATNIATALATVITTGSAGTAETVPVIVWDAKGRLTSVSTATHTITLSGDALGTGSGTISVGLVATFAGGGPVGGTNTTPVVTWDTKGRVTALSTATITAASVGAVSTSTVVVTGTATLTNATVTGTHSGNSSGTNTGDQTITLSGDVLGTGMAGVATTLVSTFSAVGPVGGSATVAVVTRDTKGRVSELTTATVTPSAIGAASVGGSTSQAFACANLAFPATQSASADPNTLDDYEEGTWTPTISGSSGAPTVAYANQTGTYTKIGNLVLAHMTIATSTRTGGTGALLFKGLPFTPGEAGGGGLGFVDNITFSGVLGIYVNTGTTGAELFESSSAAGATEVGITDWANNGDADVIFAYRV